MERKHYETLKLWKNRSNRKPLVIKGARQVGKTYLVRKFAENEFQNYIEINFDETPDKQELFAHENINTVIQYLSLDAGTPIIPGQTLLFLDEIQRAPEVFARLRYFFEKRNDIHIIAAGSLLDFLLADHSFSMPVGRIEYMHMGPMDFMEYLLATGEKHLCDFIEQYETKDEIPKAIHNKLLDHLRVSMCIGGLPAAVREYTQSQSLLQCEMELESIIATYRDDFSKYRDKTDPEILQLVLDKVPSLVGKKVKYTEISRTENSGSLKKAIEQLERARVLYRIYHSSGNAVPLRAERKERDFKFLFLDSGLMMHSLGLNIMNLRNENLILANNGALTEQFIGQQWFNQQLSYEEPELYYWNREKTGSSAEVDYLFQIEGKIVPVEVKSGTTGSLKSLHVVASEKKSPLGLRYNLDRPALTSVTSRIPGKAEHTFKLLSLPLYMVSETGRLIRGR